MNFSASRHSAAMGVKFLYGCTMQMHRGCVSSGREPQGMYFSLRNQFTFVKVHVCQLNPAKFGSFPRQPDKFSRSLRKVPLFPYDRFKHVLRSVFHRNKFEADHGGFKTDYLDHNVSMPLSFGILMEPQAPCVTVTNRADKCLLQVHQRSMQGNIFKAAEVPSLLVV